MMRDTSKVYPCETPSPPRPWISGSGYQGLGTSLVTWLWQRVLSACLGIRARHPKICITLMLVHAVVTSQLSCSILWVPTTLGSARGCRGTGDPQDSLNPACPRPPRHHPWVPPSTSCSHPWSPAVLSLPASWLNPRVCF